MVAPLLSLLILGFLVIVHELGHFLVARWTGVRTLRFSIGFGPRLFTWVRGQTEYAVSLIPLGGYVKMAGEQQHEHSREPWEYLSKPIRTRAAIIFAGPLVNYVVALVCLWVVFVIGYPELSPVVGNVLDEMPAQAAGLQVGDRIVAVNDRAVETWDEMTKLIYASANQPLALRIDREGTPSIVTVTPRPRTMTDPLGRQRTVGLIGIAPSGAFRSRRLGPIAAIGSTIQKHNEWIGQTISSLWALVTGKLSMRESMTGPIGIVYLTSEAVRLGLAPLLSLVSLFSLSLALFNLFPIPILDGGHLFFLTLEKLRGVPVSLNVQERSAQVSLVLLVTLVVMVCINDVNRFGLVEKVVEWVRR